MDSKEFKTQGIYCGNNARDPRILDGSFTIGTNYRCLQKGVGIGLHLPITEEKILQYNQEYVPIDDRKFYCGNKDPLPEKYFALGSPSICLHKGIGVGMLLNSKKKQKEQKIPLPKTPPTPITLWPESKTFFNFYDKKSTISKDLKINLIIFYITTSLIIFTTLFLLKPKWITKRDKHKHYKFVQKSIVLNNTKKYNFTLLICYPLFFSLILTIIYYYLLLHKQ